MPEIAIMKVCLTSLIVVISLTLSTAVTISEEPTDMMIDQGSRLRLSCHIDGLLDNHEVVWQKNNESISMGQDILTNRFVIDRKRYGISGGREKGFFDLKITNVIRMDEGEYKCIVFNKTDENVTILVAESRAARLTVYYTPLSKYPYCPFDAATRELELGEKISACVSEIGKPPVMLELQGRYADMPRTMLNHTTMPGFVVLFMIITETDQGRTYTCRARSEDFPFYTSTCAVGPLRIVYPPRVAIRPGKAVLSSGEEGVFTCEVIAHPQPRSIVWSSVPPLEKSRYKLYDGNRTLKIIQLRKSDDNRLLECSVDNGRAVSSSRRVLALTTMHQRRDGNENPGRREDRFHFGLTGCSEANAVIVACLAAMIILVTLLISVACCRCKSAGRKSANLSRGGIAFRKRRRRVDPIDATYTMSSDNTQLIINDT